MKLNIFVRFAFLFALFICTSAVFAQTEPVAGGYTEASVKDKEVLKAARFAVKERAKSQSVKIKLLEVKKAKMQIVAGKNYQVCMLTNYSNKESDKPVDQFVRVVVYRDLKNKFSLTSWTEENCVEEEKPQ